MVSVANLEVGNLREGSAGRNYTIKGNVHCPNLHASLGTECCQPTRSAADINYLVSRPQL